MRTPLVVAHRGANREAPENTVEAFARAVTLGADGVELDVHRTADDGVVVHHDAEADGAGVLAEATLAAIRAARPDIPTLEEALDACRDHLVNIEVKNLPPDADYDPDDRTAQLVVELVAARDRRDDVLVSSFNPSSIDRVKTLDERIPTALLIMRGFTPAEGLDLVHQRGHQALHPFVGSLAGHEARATTDRAHELGIRVNVWTVNDESEMKRLAESGVDGIVTDVPDLALQAFRA